MAVSHWSSLETEVPEYLANAEYKLLGVGFYFMYMIYTISR